MKRRVTIVTDAISRTRGGAEIYLANLAELLAHSGHPVRVLTRQPCPDALPKGVKLEVVDTGIASGTFREIAFARGVRNKLANAGDDTVLSTVPIAGATHYQPHSGIYRAGFAASGESLEPGLRKNFHRLGDTLNRKRRWLAARQDLLFTSPDGPRIMTFSNAVRNQIRRNYGVPENRLTTAALGVDLERFQPEGEMFPRHQSPRLVLLFAAHNFRLKGLHCLLAALIQAVEKGLDAELRIIGNDSAAPFQKALDHRTLKGRVEFLGAVNDQEMACRYRGCDVLMHPTFSDHCSLVVLEALACGRPVITTQQNGAAELFESGREGFVVSHPRDLTALTNALLEFKSKVRLKEMSRAAVALRPQINFADHAQKVLDWLFSTTPANHASRSISKTTVSPVTQEKGGK